MSGSRGVSRWLVTGALTVFALSGAAGLIYQAIWSQYLGLFLGHAAYAQSLVLAIFMGGMALGAWWVSRHGTGWRNLLRAYGHVELVIGIAALLFHHEFLGVTDLAYSHVFPALSAGWLTTAFKWISAVVLILPQSILLGMTFPLMSNGVMRASSAGGGSILGGLYFSNSMGAAIGALVATFVLLPWIGLPGAMRIGAALNIVVALLAYLLAAAAPGAVPAASSAGNTATVTSVSRVLLAAAFITGASSFVYEIGWVRMLSLALGSTVHAFELMLAAFIGGLAFGGWWIRKRIDGYADAMKVGGYVQLLMGLAALASLLLYDRSFDWVAWFMQALARTEPAYVAYNVVSAAVAVAIMAPAAFFAGMTLPLFTLALLRSGTGEAAVGRIYAANTIGAIVGVFCAVHLLIPGLGLKLAMIIAALADLVLGAYLLRAAPSAQEQRGPYLAALVVIAVSTAVTLLGARFDPLAMSAGVYRTGNARLMNEDQKIVFYRDGKTASIGVRETRMGRRTIATNGKPDAAINMKPGTEASVDEFTMITAALLPLSLHPAPQDVANIGFGSGLTTHTVLTDPRVQRVDTIEIEPAMIEGAKMFRPAVEHAYTDPRSHLHIEDARSYFTAHKSKYDVIISEPSNPWVSGVASLFSREFYRFVPRHLKPRGLFVQWIQLYEINDELVSTVINALSETFVDYRVYMANFGDMMIVASADGPIGDIDMSRIDGEELNLVRSRVSLDKPSDLGFHAVGGRSGIAPLIEAIGDRANSDFYPILSLEAPRTRFRSTMATTLVGLPTADLPFVELLNGVALPDGELSPNPAYPRVMYRTMALRIVQSRGGADAPGLGLDLSQKLGFVRERVGRCRDGTDTASQLQALHDLAAETVPYLKPGEMRGLWIDRDWGRCEQMAPAVAGLLDLIAAQAARDHSQTLAKADRLLEEHRAELPDPVADYVLRAGMLGGVAAKDYAAVLRLAETYRDSVHSTPVTLLHRGWMVNIARAGQGGQKAAAAP
ncbi:fused MFS/spermidine synthase [Tahibacter caeni]|uniref:fused MFS/spermidine synthase n=1 Tax=Tahibacter caeni TaxID=1453545 RepID=UPI0021477F76|nr:fused MFS/spermidine synthase [Tahibacter caeni]